jgi:hypothetical protein
LKDLPDLRYLLFTLPLNLIVMVEEAFRVGRVHRPADFARQRLGPRGGGGRAACADRVLSLRDRPIELVLCCTRGAHRPQHHEEDREAELSWDV